MEFKKNEKCILTISDLGVNGEGIGKIDGFTIFVNNALPEEKVEVLLVKVKKSYAYAKLLNILKPSEYRTTPKCDIADKCGGCSIQHMDYNAQLRFKQKMVQENLKRIGGFENVSVNPVVGMENPFFYRNKGQYPVRKNRNGDVDIGFYAMSSHRVINCNKCFIADKSNSEIIKILREFIQKNNISVYDEEAHKGIVRHILVRNGFKTGDLMVCLVVNCKQFKFKNELVKAFENVDNIKSIVINYNTEKTNVILGNRCETVYGNDEITSYIGNVRFNISPLAFFQVNPVQTEKLYNYALDFADLTGDETVIDAYCGIGTITLFLAQNAKQVYGVEIVPQAIENANKNAGQNNMKNVRFFCGKSEIVVPELFEKNAVKPDVIVVDPPRKGCENSLLELILDMQPSKIVYVSCDSATLARDLKTLCKNDEYKIERVQPVDMFPHSMHVETVCLLSRKTQ